MDLKNFARLDFLERAKFFRSPLSRKDNYRPGQTIILFLVCLFSFDSSKIRRSECSLAPRSYDAREQTLKDEDKILSGDKQQLPVV